MSISSDGKVEKTRVCESEEEGEGDVGEFEPCIAHSCNRMYVVVYIHTSSMKMCKCNLFFSV